MPDKREIPPRAPTILKRPDPARTPLSGAFSGKCGFLDHRACPIWRFYTQEWCNRTSGTIDKRENLSSPCYNRLTA